MKLSKEFLGKTFQVYLEEGADYHSEVETSRKIDAALIIYDGGDPDIPFALGWKIDQHSPKNRAELNEAARQYSCSISQRVHINELADYPFYLWVPANTEIEGAGLIKNEPSKDGATCSRCHLYSVYASANQPDGSFKCWSCKTYPHYK